ncbi:MAG: hypothetical protein OEL54_05055 [Flavobacteriaceae bacterium]|nr:hypothetical protein [Flavobacteriaceae bacterium]
MKKIILSAAALFFVNLTNAQLDIITKHNGESVEGKVIRVEEYSVTFKYEGEDSENTLGKYAIEKVIYGKSGRIENFSEKIIVNNEDDWEKVVILEDKSYIAGLKKEGEIKGKTGFISLHTGNTANKKAEMKLKKDAAKMGCPFILMTSDKDINQPSYEGPTLGAVQSIKKGIAYKY